MKKVRKNVFETNSSSTHSICIAKNVEYDIPEKLYLELGDFGWEQNTLNSTSEKASYLYTGLVNYFPEKLNGVVDTLKSKGIEVTMEEEKENSWDNGYVDHGSDLDDFIKGVTESEDRLLSFLFSGLSFIHTGNDNSDHDVDVNVSYDHDEYYKGN